jgi:3-oxoacyl-(acyl-carrier-protein) synthase
MYALHSAVNAIRSGDCSGAIVGGSNLILAPEMQLLTVKLGALSPTSTCHTFDASADGYGRGEGFGALYLKKYSDAIAGGYPIRALIRGTAVNANGRTAGISHPSVEGQESLIRKTYRNAGLPTNLTAYFECHGTGTPTVSRYHCSSLFPLTFRHFRVIQLRLQQSEKSLGQSANSREVSCSSDPSKPILDTLSHQAESLG